MVRIFFPVKPVRVPSRSELAKRSILSSSAWVSRVTFCPSTTKSCWPWEEKAPGARKAVCKTARSSVLLMWAPEYIFSMASRRPARSANSTRCVWTVSSSQFLDKSMWSSPAENDHRRARSRSEWKSERRLKSWLLARVVSRCHSAVEEIDVKGLTPLYDTAFRYPRRCVHASFGYMLQQFFPTGAIPDVRQSAGDEQLRGQRVPRGGGARAQFGLWCV